MARMNASDLDGAALDWAVAQSEGLPIRRDPMGFVTGSEAGFWVWGEVGSTVGIKGLIGREYSPSTNWSQGGEIVERLREQSRHQFWVESDGPNTHVLSWPDEHAFYRGYGPTMLIALMRCYVACKLGEIVEVPEPLSSAD
jgi:hypothetical protein